MFIQSLDYLRRWTFRSYANTNFSIIFDHKVFPESSKVPNKNARIFPGFLKFASNFVPEPSPRYVFLFSSSKCIFQDFMGIFSQLYQKLNFSIPDHIKFSSFPRIQWKITKKNLLLISPREICHGFISLKISTIFPKSPKQGVTNFEIF